MTGESIPTKENWPRLKPYYKKLASLCILAVSFVLLVEHLWTYGGFDLLDILGHETYALIGIAFVVLWNTKWKQWGELKLWKLRNILR